MRTTTFLSFVLAGVVFTSCQPSTKKEAWIEKALDVASYQLNLTAEEMKDSVKMPRSLWTGYTVDFLEEQLERESATFVDSLWPNPAKEKLGTLRSCDIYDWTSGFFPGSLWYAYELTGNERLKEEAVRYTNRLYPVRKYRDNHDIGFMMNCSYGNAFRMILSYPYCQKPPIIFVHVLMYRLAVFVPGISVHGIIPSLLTT